MATNVAIVFTGRDRNTQALAKQLSRELEGLRDEGERLTNTLSKIGVGLSAAGIIAYGRALTASLSGLDDLAEMTGESVENLSMLAAEARISGTEIDKVAGFANRLAKGLLNADDETKDVGRALKALGVDARDANGQLKNTPQLMREIAQALQTVQEGPGRQNILQALGGRSGAELIPFFNDLARSGEQVARVTTAQAAASEQAERAWRGLFLEINQASTSLLVQALPADEGLARGLTAVIRANQDLGRDNGVAQWAENAAVAAAVVIDALSAVPRLARAVAGSFEVVFADLKLLAEAAATAAIAPTKVVSVITGEAMRERNAVLERANGRWSELWNYNGRAVEESVRRSIAAIRLGNQAVADFDANADARDLRLARRRAVDFTATTGGAAARVTPPKEQISESQRELARFVETLARQREQLEEISRIEQVLQFLRANPGVDTPQVRELLIGQAQLNDALERERDIRRELARIAQEEIAAQRALDDQLNQLTGRAEEARKIALTARLEARLAAGEIFTADELDRAVKGIAGIRDEVKNVADEAERFGLVFASSLGRFIEGGGEGGARGFFDSLSQDLLKLTTQLLIVEPLAKAVRDALSGGGTGGGGGGGGGWIGAAASFFGGLFGGARADGGPVSAGRAYLVGERGPEMFVPRGSGQIVPNGAGMRPVQVANTFVLQGPVDRRTQEQVAAAAARSLVTASRRYN